MEEKKFTPPSDAVLEGPKKKSFTPPSDAILKKKEPSQPTSQESVWGSNSQPKDAYTSLVIDQQIPQQESVISDGEQPKPILKGLPSVESLKKKTIQPKKETVEIIKDVVPKVAKAISIEKNKEDFSEATQKARKESKSLVDKKQIDQKIYEVSSLQNQYAKSLKDIDLAKKQLSDEKAEIDYQLSIGNNTPEFQQKIALHNAKVQENLDKFNLLKDKSEVINYNKKVIESASGNLLRDKAEQGNWFGAIYNKMLESASSMASGAVSRVTDLIAEVVPSEYLIGPKELKRLKDKGLDQNQIDDYIKKSAKKDVLPAIRKGNVELFGDKGTTEEYIKKKESSGLIEGGILGLAGSVPAMLGGVYGRATNFFLMGSDAVEKEMESNPDFQNISENEKLAVIVPIGIANAVLEEFGLQGVMKNNSIVNNLVHKTLLKVGADASADTFKRAMNSEIKSGIASGLFKVGSGFTSEAITGGSQQAAEIGIKDIYNVVKDKKMFQTPETLSDAVSQISDAAIMEGIGGTVMSTLPAINTAMQNNELGKKSTDFEFEILDNINENSEEFKKLFTTDLKNKMIEGKITKDEAESQLKSFDKMTATFNRMPKDMSIEDKKKSFDLLVEKDKLTNEINGKDESLSTKQKERISEINKELSDISLGVKPKEDVAVETPEAAITEITPKSYVEELTKTKESDPETYWSVSEVSAEDAAKGTIIDTPNGSALVKPDGDIAGLFKKPTSDAKGVAQDLLNKAVAAGGIKLDNFDGYLTNQYEKAGFRVVSRTPFNEQYAPEGWNKEKHGTPDVVAMVYDPNNELDIEEKVFENPETGYDDAIAYRDSFVGQAKALTTEVNNTQELIDESEKSNDLPSLVEKAKTALSGILPNVDVVLYNTEEEYKKAVGESLSSGTFVDDTIHINPKRANGRTVAHEVFHAVLLSMVKTDPEAQRITAKMITAIEKVLPPDMKAKLQQFVEDGYDGQDEVWDEEKLAELIGFLADGYPSLSKPAQSLIKQWLDQIAKFFGLKEFTDAEVVDLMNTLSGKVSKGEVLTEEDIKILGPAKINVTTESVRKSKFIDSLVFNRFPTNKNTKVVENFDIKSINGQVAASTLSDKLTAGELKKYKTVDGKKVLESVYTFFGGIGYPEVTGRIWAASTMSGVQKIINDMVVSSDGYRYLIPAVMSNVSHMSNKNMTSITMEVFKEAINNKELNRTDFKNLVSKAFNNKDTIKFKDDAIKSISGNISADKMVNNLRDYVLSSNMTFESRKKLLESMVGNPVSGNPKFSTVGTFLSLATSLSDPIAKDAQLYQVPVIIRTKGNLTPVQSKKGDEFYHESYGYHIESDQEVEVLHLDGTYNLTDIIPEFTNEVGRTVSTEQEIKEKSAKGWDIKRILTNLGRTHGLSRYSAKIDYKDKTSRKQVSSEFNKELNDKEINLLRRSLRMKFKDSFVVEVLDDYVNSIKEDTYANNEATQYLLDNGVTLNRLANLMVEEGNFETKSRALGYFNTVGGLGESVLSRKQMSLESDKDYKPGYEVALDNLNETEEDREAWRSENKVNQKQKRNTVVEQAVKDYYNEDISQEQYLDIVSKNQPIKPFKTVPDLPTLNDVVNSLDKSKVATGIIGLTKGLKDGERVASRLDIPAYEDFDTWVVSVHDGNKEGKSIAYGQTAVLKNVDFKTFPGPAIRIAMGTQNKSTIARMFGDWINEDPEVVHSRAKELINDPAWTQVGMNPFRYSWFYDKADGMPLASSEEVVQVGALVLAKNAVKVSPSDPMFQTKSSKGNLIRFQRSSTPIARLKKEGKTEKQISKYLQSKGFTIEQATEAILNYNKQKMNTLQKQEGVFTRDGRNKVITSLDSFKRMFLSAKAFLPKNAFIAKENIEAGIKAQSKIASYLVNDLDVAIKNYDGDKEKVISDFDKFVRGEEVELPDNFIEIGNAMRDHIDKLSYELINSGIVDEYQAENIRKNIGTYLTRSYEVFDKDNWAEKVDQEVLQAAKNFLKKQLLSEATKEAKKKGLDVKSVLENKVDLAINDLIDREGAQSFVSSGKTGSKDVSILKQKTDIPFEIRALMGEYTDPAQNYSRTIFKIASLINNAKFLNTVRDNGIGVYLFEKNDINRPKEFDTLIAAEGSETMNPLNGLYTTKEIAGSLKESAGILNSIEVALPFEVSSTVKSTYEYYMKLLSTVKWLKTVGSVGTHFKNVSGNITFMLANGYFKPDEYRKSAQVIHNDFFNRTDKELRGKMQEYVDAGIVDQSAVLGELRSMFKDADFDKSFERRMNNEELNPSKKFVDKVKRLGKKGVSLAENAYQAEDDYFKVISYETEKSRYAKAMYGKEYSKLTESQQDDVKNYVTEITKNVLPNYGRVPGAVKLVKAFPVVGTFISFQTEALRTAYNIVNLSITELKSSNPDIKKIGALRMAGIISSQAVKYAMMYLIGGAVLGDDEDEKKKKAKRFVAPWSKNSNILIKNEGDGKFSYIDFSASDPFGGIVKPINAMMAGEDLLDGFIEGVKEVVSPFTNPDILKSMFTEISENKDAYGNQLYNPSDTFEKKSEAILSRVYKTFEPGTISSARKIADSDGALNEMAGQFTGYKANDVDLEKQFSFKISDMKKKEVEVRNIYNRAARKFENKEVSKEELQKAYNQSNQESKKLYEELKKDYDAAIYFGTDAKALKKEMKRAKVSKEIIRSILTGKFKDMEKKKSPLTDEELKKKNPKLYEMRMRMRKATN